jgi:hypothetical protein
MTKRTISILAIVALCALPVMAGEWHAGTTNLCTDCHTMHFSQTHAWNSANPVSTTPTVDGNWLSATGPNHYLLKAPVNEICLACHDGQTFAPDVLGSNFNASSHTDGRSAGALNRAGTPGYSDWQGHTLDSTATPPGYLTTGIFGDVFPTGSALECINCHTQHGRDTAYRNLGPRRDAGGTDFIVTYIKAATPDPTVNVTINAGAYTAGSGDPATFAQLYDTSSISYARIDGDTGTFKTSNLIDTHCAACHGEFHGGSGDALSVGGTGGVEFSRHPTAQAVIGAVGGGHSNLPRYVAATTKVKVYTNDYTGYTGSVPGCVSCHKAHGNQNPFGLVFLGRNTTTVTEQGDDTYIGSPLQGYRALCGQCHVQGP